MRTLIVTVAGTATRFNRDTAEPTLKCLYYEESPEYALLSQILAKTAGYDRLVIVGGYLFDKLGEFVDRHLGRYRDRIRLVYNERYDTYGSGYSLIRGIEAVEGTDGEVLFVEGDLYFDSASYTRVLQSQRNVITVNREFILAEKAVALYVDEAGAPHYIYDTSHRSLAIPVPFRAVYNSGQIWKFRSADRLRGVVAALSPEQVQGTNLEIVQGYFDGLPAAETEFVPIETWHNCNTVADYRDVYAIIKQK